MTNRFDNEKHLPHLSEKFYGMISVLIFIFIAFCFIQAVELSGKNTIQKQQESLQNAIARDILQCYATEGAYPPSLEYMEQHYGLTYDKDTFFIDYQPIASNLYPDYTIIMR